MSLLPLYQSRLIEEALGTAKLGCFLPNSEPFWCREEVQDVMAFLNIIADPRAADCDLLQAVLTRPDRGLDAGREYDSGIDDCKEGFLLLGGEWRGRL